ncbi:MAG: LysR family transcriptional regulator [Proteobacteria bacterium]|nr:LysR family transcriptional regulator [Pseudomonadota bacterium]
MITLRQVDAFRAVMITGTITGAAEMMNISQPAVTRLIQELERALGFDLFTRQGRQIVPTVESRLFFDEVETSHLGLDQLTQSAANIREHKEGSLRLVTIPSVVTMFIGQILKAFDTAFPNVAVSLEVQPTQRVFEYITSGQCDLGISTLPMENPAVVSQPVLRGQSVCIFPKRHRLHSKAKITPKDLEGEEFISYRSDSLYRHRVDQVFSKSKVNRSLRYEARTTDTICKLVANGIGVSVIGPSFPGVKLESGIEVRPFTPALHGDLALLYLKHRESSRLIRAFSETVVQTLRASRPRN